MHARRQAGVSPLAIVLPHPPLPRRRSSLLSAGSCSSPHTPRSCGSPSCSSLFFTTNNNRNSTDSWNSSTQDVGEQLESEWKPEQTLLLQRTLDALPAHLVTPFYGQIPPPNLLEKIARGVADAKGKADWPHSIPATRTKLVEIARLRAAELSSRKYIADDYDEFTYMPEEGEDPSLCNDKPAGVRRPLYRQSSMDFISPAATTSLKNNGAMERLSNLIERPDRTIVKPAYHPYSRHPRTRSQTTNRRSSSPPRPVNVPSLISPSSPSSSTLNSFSSISVGARPRRSASTLSSVTSSDSLMGSPRASVVSSTDSSIAADKTPFHLLPSALSVAPDPRVTRVRRSESFCGPAPPFMSAPISSRQSLKRAPSFGAIAQEAKARTESLGDPASISSDEEEKARNRTAKKVRVKTTSPPPSSTSKELPPIPPKKSKSKSKTSPSGATVDKKSSSSSPVGDMSSLGLGKPNTKPKLRMNLQRNPSIFGEELPHIHATSSPVSVEEPTSSPRKTKTLRRVKRLSPPSRKIEFGGFLDGADADVDGEGEAEDGALGSAFQLR